MRLIDADALLKSVCEVKPEYDGYIKAVRDIVNAPTIDAVQVVRCRDCRHWIQDKEISTRGECRFIEGAWNADSFCSDGERSSNETDDPQH